MGPTTTSTHLPYSHLPHPYQREVRQMLHPLRVQIWGDVQQRCFQQYGQWVVLQGPQARVARPGSMHAGSTRGAMLVCTMTTTARSGSAKRSACKGIIEGPRLGGSDQNLYISILYVDKKTWQIKK